MGGESYPVNWMVLFFIGLALFAVVMVIAVGAGPAEAGVVVFGDSWGVPAGPALQSVFTNHGHSETVYNAAIGGTRAAPTGNPTPEKNLSGPAGLQHISDTLAAHPDANLIHLSLWGNDFLLNWEAGMGAANEVSAFATIIGNVETIVDHMLSVRPEARVFWSSYDYLRPFDLGTPQQVNAAFSRFWNGCAQVLADSKGSSLTFHDFSGLMQITYGFDGIQYTPYDPAIPIPAGDPSLPDPGLPGPNAAFVDNVHLTTAAYLILAEEQYNVFYRSQIVELGADFDQDDDVDGADFLAWQRSESPIPLSQSDLDDWQASFGSVISSATAASTAVPEPSTGILLMLGMVAMLLRLDLRALHGPGWTDS
jgi:GDSL-like lipase/acylhydrolase family protein